MFTKHISIFTRALLLEIPRVYKYIRTSHKSKYKSFILFVIQRLKPQTDENKYSHDGCDNARQSQANTN